MSAIQAYDLISTLLLALMAAIWSAEGLHNITIKALFAGAMVFGAIMCARAFAL